MTNKTQNQDALRKPEPEPEDTAANEAQAQQEEALRILAEKDPEFDADIANTNERLASTANDDPDFIKASIAANNPVGSAAAYRDPKAEKKVRDALERDAAKDAK